MSACMAGANRWVGAKAWGAAQADLGRVLGMTQATPPTFALRLMEQRCEVAWQVCLGEPKFAYKVLHNKGTLRIKHCIIRTLCI